MKLEGLLIFSSLLLALCALRPASGHAFTPFSPSNLLRDGEGLVGLDGGLVNETLNVTGSFGTGAARTRYELRGVALGGVGGYGFTDRMDGYLRFGAMVSPSWGDKEKSNALVGGVGCRYMIAGSRAAELGLFGDVEFISAAENDTNLTIGNVNAPGRVELRNLINVTLGIGPQWWWRVGAQKYIMPSLYAFFSPRFVGSGLYRQAGASADTPAKELDDIEASAKQLAGFGGSVGLDLRTVIFRSNVRWLGALGGALSVEVPF
ncbi:MAG: hypothetical protein HYT87_05745 [Nitrospirae bacterium]|nr:hypothetical protein [Nitrospirota bacterium]